jgi:spore coat protein A
MPKRSSDQIRLSRRALRIAASGPLCLASRLLAAALAIGAFVSPVPSHAAVATLAPVKDNTLYEDPGGSLSNGAGAYLFAGKTNDSLLRRALLAFDPSSAIPAGATIQSATLTLTQSRVKANDPDRLLALHLVTRDWGEATSDAEGEEGAGAPAAPGDATWLHSSYDTAFWASPGGDYTGTASASRLVPRQLGSYSWSSAAMAQDVRDWLDSPSSNAGWILIGAEGIDETARRFNSRQHPEAATRPVLEVVFDPPADTGACCDGSGGCTITTSTGCVGTYEGDDSTCEPSPCTGACCLADGSCSEDQTLAECAAAGGSYQGDEVACSGVTCPVPTGACCVPGEPGSCSETSAATCGGLGGTFQGVDTLCQVDLCPFVDELPRPAIATPVTGTSSGAASYDMAMTEFTQVLHRDLPATTVWGYGGSYPGPTIEARSGQPVTVRWINDLRDNGGALRAEHYLAVDTCMHGPDHEGAAPRTVVHLHGGHVPPEVDGYPEDTFLPGEEVTYVYPNNQDAATLWFHDHALGITRLNVYMGLSGLYLLRDDVEDSLGLPAAGYEIPLVIQDRAFNPDGSLSYPADWQDHFFGDKILVNGKVWPYLEVDRGKYRFRVLNGSNSRVYTLTFDDGTAAAPFAQIGSEGGFLTTPVTGLTELTLSPGERADLVIDFAGYPAGSEIVLTNSAVAPFPNGPAESVVPDVMKFIVGDETGHAAPLPTSLRPLETLDEADSLRERELVLTKEFEACAGSWWVINGLGWDDITEQPVLGTTEVWSFVNQTGVVHPMHMHLVFFQVLDRQPFELVGGEITPTGERVFPEPEEAGWKDTVQAPPGQITRVIARFDDYTGLYPYHCHILEHEDHEMMRQFEVLGGTITVAKTVSSGAPPTSFTFGGDVAGVAGDGETLSTSPLPPGAYSATETVPANWELRSISCDDPDSGGEAAGATATFALSVADIEARQPVTCTFANCILGLVVSGTATGTRVYEACDTIYASSFTIATDPGGTDIEFRARSSVALGDAFTVEGGTSFRVILDPDL